MVEQCTYDGTIHNAEMILKRIGHLCDYILFDEAWAGFMKFHPLYAGRFAMGLSDLGPDAPGIIATQSTHKQLASFSQASQIHIKDRHIHGQKRRVEHRRFNESFMQHASTSPFYPLFASLDVGAQMMKGRSGEVLWDDTIRLGIELRKKIRAVRREFEEKETRPERRWFFEPFVPDRVAIPDVSRDGAVHNVAWETISTDQLATNPSYWQLAPDAAWHGFPDMAAGFAMTDPNKLTLLTPGFDRATGGYAEHGIPAPVVAQYLRENRIVAEKNDLNSLLFLLTPGVEASKAGTLISGLVAFKKLHDDNAALEEAIPEFYRRRSARYAGVRLRDLCADMHRFFRDADVSALQAKQFFAEHLPDIAMSPRDAARYLVRNDVDYLPIDAIAGRIATTPFVVYPPGIATIVPGERLTERAQPMIDYLKMFETCFNTFPGFDVEIQGVYRGSRCVRPHPAAYLRGLANESADGTDKPSRGERTAGARPAVARQRCRGDAGDLPPPYPARHRGRRRRQRHAGAGRSARPAQEPAQSPLPASGGDPRRRGRRLCLCRAVSQAAGLPLHGQALDLYPSRASRPRRRTAADAGTDRRLRGGRLPADDRLYRCRQYGLARDSRKVRLSRVGLLPGVAYRYGRWADTVMVQRSLAAGSTEPPLISSFGR